MTGKPQGPWWLATCFLLAGCGAAGAGGGAHAVSTGATSGAGITGGAPGTSPVAAAEFSCAAHSGGDATLTAQLTGVRAASHTGYDRLTFEFAAPVTGAALAGVPAYTLASQTTTLFFKDASGQPLTVAGSAALRLVAQHSSGWDNLAPVLKQTYTGSLDIRPDLVQIREVAEIGDNERVLSWGVGLASPACVRVTQLSDPSRLVIDVQTAS